VDGPDGTKIGRAPAADHRRACRCCGPGSGCCTLIAA
jgi:hypothetical protein